MISVRIVVALALCGIAAAQARAQPIDHGDPVDREAGALFLSAGEPYPIEAWPARPAELEAALRALAERAPESRSAALDLAGRLSRLRESAYFSLDLSFDGSVRSDDRLAPNERAATFDTRTAYLDRAPMAELRLGAATEGASADLGFVARKEWRGDFASRDNLPRLGEVGNPIALDNHLMERADLRLTVGPAALSLGRSPLRLGPRGFSSLYPGDGLPYLDRAGLSVRFGAFGLDWLIATIQPIRAFDGYDAARSEQLEGGTGQRPTILAVKRLSLRSGKLGFGLGQVELYSRSAGYYTLTDFLPLMDWHAADVKPNNMSLIFDLSWAPVPGVETFATLGLDDIGGAALGIADSGVPTIWAGLVGAGALLDLPFGRLAPRVQAGYAHYLWGNYDAAASGHGSEPSELARAIYRYKSDGGSILVPLSSPFGPGSAWFRLDSRLSRPGSALAFGLDVLVLAKWPAVDLVSTPYESDPDLEGLPPFAVSIVGLGLEYDKAWLSARLAPMLQWTPDLLAPALDASLRIRVSGPTTKR